MSGPLEFAARFLVQRGALVEATAAGAEALLSRELAAELGLGEHAFLAERSGSAAHHVGYGSALLERMVASAAKTIPFVRARAHAAPVRGSQARAAAEALVFRNGVFTVGEPAADLGHRLLLHAAFTFHGDERREGLCAAASSFATHGVVGGFHEAASGTLEEATAEPLDPVKVIASARVALAACAAIASEASEGFREGSQRRFGRDRERLEGYFDDLASELDRRAARGRANRGDVDDKRRVLELERAAKLEALSARYVMKLELRPIALVLVEAPVCRIPLELRRRKASRSIELEYDCATRRLVAPVCDVCGSAAPRPAACDEALHLLCEGCAPRSEGRVECSACRTRRGGHARRQTTGDPAPFRGVTPARTHQWSAAHSGALRPATGDT
jgi:hypothetical protein